LNILPEEEGGRYAPEIRGNMSRWRGTKYAPPQDGVAKYTRSEI